MSSTQRDSHLSGRRWSSSCAEWKMWVLWRGQGDVRVWVGECGSPGVRRREGPYKNNNSNPQITGTSTVMYSYTLPPHPHIEHIWFPVWPRLWHCDWAESGDSVQADSWCLHDLQRLTQALQRLLPLLRHHLLPQSLSTAPVQSLRSVS